MANASHKALSVCRAECRRCGDVRLHLVQHTVSPSHVWHLLRRSILAETEREKVAARHALAQSTEPRETQMTEGKRALIRTALAPLALYAALFFPVLSRQANTTTASCLGRVLAHACPELCLRRRCAMLARRRFGWPWLEDMDLRGTGCAGSELVARTACSKCYTVRAPMRELWHVASLRCPRCVDMAKWRRYGPGRDLSGVCTTAQRAVRGFHVLVAALRVACDAASSGQLATRSAGALVGC